MKILNALKREGGFRISGGRAPCAAAYHIQLSIGRF